MSERIAITTGPIVALSRAGVTGAFEAKNFNAKPRTGSVARFARL